MAKDSREPSAIFSKSQSLIEKMVKNVRGLDNWLFPTTTSDFARELFLSAIETLRDPKTILAVDPAVLYNRLFSLQNVADFLERSATDRISRPLVSYCDQIWSQIFGETGPRIFYSLTPKHNYLITKFSECLRNSFLGVVPREDLRDLVPAPDLYCLELASSEDENSPLYANIGHEFGHALYNLHKAEILIYLNTHVKSLLEIMYADLKDIDLNQSGRRFRRLTLLITRIAEELFCDLVGALLMGPSFFLSLFEFSWGLNKKIWKVCLSPDDRQSSAYPSFSFRLHCIGRSIDVKGFCDGAGKEFKKALPSPVNKMHDCLAAVPLDHKDDSVGLLPKSDLDAQELLDILTKHLADLKVAFEGFVVECVDKVESWCRVKQPVVDVTEVAQLILRLHHNILPNIVPNDTLLGVPATFQGMLASASIFRLSLLESERVLGSEPIFKRCEIVERLTAKAFEVSFVQREFNEFRGGKENQE